MQSFKEILSYLHEVGAPLRQKTPPRTEVVEGSAARVKTIKAV